MKAKAIILATLGKLQKEVTFEQCHKNKTFYDGVKHGIKLSKKTIENLTEEELKGEKIKSDYQRH